MAESDEVDAAPAAEFSAPPAQEPARAAAHEHEPDDDELDELPPSRLGPKIAAAGFTAAVLVIGAVMALRGGDDSVKPPPPKVVESAPLIAPSPVAEAVTPTPGPAVAELAPTPAPAVAEVEPKVTPAPVVAEVKPVVAEVKPVEAAPEGDYADLLAQGRALYGKGQSKKAILPLTQAVAVKPDGDEALVVLANCWLDRGNMQKALSFAQQAVQSNPGNAEAYLVVGAVEQQNDHNAEARNAYEKYLKLSPKGQYANDIRSILKTLK
jgi:hypothetical protein